MTRPARQPPAAALPVPSLRAARFRQSWDRVWRRLRDRHRGCRLRPTRTHIHRLRVATRRALAHVDFCTALEIEVDARGRRRLRRLLRASGDTRDAQVQLALLESALPARQHPDFGRFRKYLRKRERRLVDAFAARLRQRKFDLPASPLPGTLPRRALAGAEAVFSTALARVGRRRADAAPDDSAALHRLRVALKKYRYLAEIFPPAARSPGAAALARLKRLQSALGDLHDRDVLHERLEKFAAKHGAARPWLRAQRAVHRRRRRDLLAQLPAGH